ncbi:hypothetical protein GXW78_06770 [Roseomonas terrae]|uniref:HPt domain-containing protein n=1 Tax=Neoroseomonas terrae TaxID=424799 RepID=A0ABS5EEB9_9PROT|nr:hypothetical protein [Neoroseomonas terrae]MBR0649358.1 hypothetical protein [Neoroseomonas terrae]
MTPHEIRVPFPLDMLGDLDTTLRHVEDRHLSGLDTPEKREGFHPLISAVRAIKAAIQAHRAKAAEDALHVPLERSHLSALLDFAQGAPGGGPDERRATTNVAEWLDQDI